MKDYLRLAQEGIEAQPFAKMMGFKAEEAGEGYAVISCKKRPDLLQQTGIIHGGAAAALCEAAAGYAALTLLPPGHSVVGVEYKINYLRPLSAERIVARASIIKAGRQLIIAEVDAYDEGSDKIAAKMILTGTVISSEG